jgi:hypothetical protein
VAGPQPSGWSPSYSSSGNTASPGGVQGTAQIQVVNSSAEPIYLIHVSQGGDWGPDLLGSDRPPNASELTPARKNILRPGEVFNVTVASGTWHVRVVDASANYKEFHNLPLSPGAVQRLDVDSQNWWHD